MSLYHDPRMVYWIWDPFWGAFHYAIYQAVRLLPSRTASDMGARLGVAEGKYRLRDWSARADRSLSLLWPELSPQRRATLIREMWENVGRLHVEMAALDRLWDAAEISVVNEKSFLDPWRAGRPIVFVFPHLGNWEALAIAVQRRGLVLNVVYENLRNRFERRLATLARSRLGYRLIAPTRQGVREIHAALRRGEAVALAIDEFKNGNVIAPAFGRALPADSNIRYALKLARNFRAAILPAYCVRTGPFAFRLTYQDEMLNPDVLDLNALCESWIRAHPEQWYMLHRLAPETLPQTAAK